MLLVKDCPISTVASHMGCNEKTIVKISNRVFALRFHALYILDGENLKKTVFFRIFFKIFRNLQIVHKYKGLFAI